MHKMLNYLIGFRSKNKSNMIIAALYYLFWLIIAIGVREYFLFCIVFFYSSPIVLFSIAETIQTKNIKHIFTAAICILVVAIIAKFSTVSIILPQKIYISIKSATFENINQNQTVNLVVEPTKANISDILFISKNTDIAAFSGNTLVSKAEGETEIYAILPGSNVKSESICITVTDKKAKQEVAQPNDISDNDSAIVYVGATGNKYHKDSCITLKGKGIQISLDMALAQGRAACKYCGG